VTIVTDASALSELLVPSNTARRQAVLDVVADDPHWAIPEHALIETVSSLRGRRLGGQFDGEVFVAAVERLSRFAFDTWPTLGLLPRILELAPNATAYDAAYVALAEELGSVLVTTDAKIARIPGIRCRVVVAG
jgi:predicted nucleic acid-binding protein